MKTHLDWLELTNYSANPTDTNPSRRGIAAVGNTLKYWNGSAWTSLGAAGADGLDITWRGEYNNSTSYNVNDAVSYNGSSYICKLASTGNLPTDTTYWDLMAQSGVSNLADLSDVALSSLAAGNILIYDGTKWANKAVSGDISIAATGATTLSSGVVAAANVKPIAGTNGTYGVPFVIPITNTGTATIKIFENNAPFKMQIIDAWAISTKAGNSGTWKVTDGTYDITSPTAYGTSDTDIVRAVDLDDAYQTVNANGSLYLVSSEATDNAIVYVSAIRIS